jgi:hypothetical protein
MKVLVCGSRISEDRLTVWNVLDAFHDHHTPIDVLITGDAPGVDSLAYSWAIKRKVTPNVYYAAWKRLGRAAGPERNQRMLDDGKPDLVIAFPGGTGTSDMVRRAREAKLPVMSVP